MGHWLAMLKKQITLDRHPTKPTKTMHEDEKTRFAGFVAYAEEGFSEPAERQLAESETHSTREPSAFLVALRKRLLQLGWSPEAADDMVQKLTRRDSESDSRVSCVECDHYDFGYCKIPKVPRCPHLPNPKSNMQKSDETSHLFFSTVPATARGSEIWIFLSAGCGGLHRGLRQTQQPMSRYFLMVAREPSTGIDFTPKQSLGPLPLRLTVITLVWGMCAVSVSISLTARLRAYWLRALIRSPASTA
jgi:hypothetical protein